MGDPDRTAPDHWMKELRMKEKQGIQIVIKLWTVNENAEYFIEGKIVVIWNIDECKSFWDIFGTEFLSQKPSSFLTVNDRCSWNWQNYDCFVQFVVKMYGMIGTIQSIFENIAVFSSLSPLRPWKKNVYVCLVSSVLTSR